MRLILAGRIPKRGRTSHDGLAANGRDDGTSISHLGKLRRDQPLYRQFVHGPLIRIGRAKRL